MGVSTQSTGECWEESKGERRWSVIGGAGHIQAD